MGASGGGENDVGDDYRRTVETSVLRVECREFRVKDVREVIQKAEGQRFFNTPNPILFIDEIHRFSKAQQDSLLAPWRKVP